MVTFANNPALLSLAVAALSVSGLLSLWWALLRPRLAIWLLGLSLVIGQLIRLPLPGQGGGLLVSDLAVLLVLVSAATVWLRSPDHKTLHQNFFKVWTILLQLFLGWAFVSTMFGLWHLNLNGAQAAVTLSYWLRLATHLALIPALVILLSRPRLYHSSRQVFIATTGTLILFGFLQFVLFSNFASLAAAGWDPHRWRLTSTWLDPNFFAAFILIATPLALTTVKHRITIFSLSVISPLALLATKSRSGLVAGLLAALLLAPLLLTRLKPTIATRRRVLLSLVAFASLAVLAATIVGPRLAALIRQDPTATLRWQSLSLIQQRLLPSYGLLGSGYNAYQYAAAEAGVNQDFSLHSRAGADNTWLTIWVTTGLPGLMLYIGLWLSLLAFLLTSWLRYRHWPSLAAAFGLLALAIHSQFVNSFLYSHLLIILAWATSLAITNHYQKNDNAD